MREIRKKKLGLFVICSVVLENVQERGNVTLRVLRVLCAFQIGADQLDDVLPDALAFFDQVVVQDVFPVGLELLSDVPRIKQIDVDDIDVDFL